jgi:glycosyltransferase involved in cell wall biosynthesis/ubiquinone/menaquinone biosynthesis C-methylase UbiE
MNYAEAYDHYWRLPDRTGSHSFEDPDPITDQLLVACGGGSVLDVGCGMGLLVATLLRRGVSAYGCDVSSVAAKDAAKRSPDRICVADLRRLPFEDDAFDTVVSTDCLEHIAEPHVGEALAEMHRVCARSVFLRISTRADRDERWHLTVQSREWWERRLVGAGFRKHPGYYDVNPYESLNESTSDITLVYEKIPVATVSGWPLALLSVERDLHMDMLREAGARSDAHVIRYHLASAYVREGDTVLDAACGLGYGAYVLHARSMALRTMGIDSSAFAVDYARANFGATSPKLLYELGNLPERLASLADNSIDVVVSFETLEHVVDPEKLLREFVRLLKPAGRLLMSIPNDWSGDDGKDPNPHHLHVYTWSKLREQLPASLIVEAAFAQTASRQKQASGERRAWQSADRRLRRIHPSELRGDTLPDCEWWIAVCMKDPVSGADVSYHETTFAPAGSDDSWHATAFARDYRNPYLVKGMVTIGHRLSDDDALLATAQRVSRVAAVDSADLGAALTVEGYRHLANRDLERQAVERFDRRTQGFLGAAAWRNAHQRRWRISLLFVLGQLWQATGDFARAAGYFEACASLDPLEFSPLLATKSVEACERLALLHMAAGDTDAARHSLTRGIAIANRALGSDWRAALGSMSHPVEFGLPELAAVLEYASACAYALAHLNLAQERPALWWSQHQRDRLSQLRRLTRVEAQTIEKNQAISEQASEIRRTNAVLDAKTSDLASLGIEIHRLHGVLQSKDSGLAEQAGQIHALHAAISEKQRAVSEQSSEIARLHDALGASGAALAAAERSAEDAVRAREATERLLAESRAAHARTEFELAAIRTSRWNMLGEALRQRPLRPANFMQIARLGREMALRRLRRQSSSRPLPDLADLPDAARVHALPEPYVIQVPQALSPERRRVLHAIANFMTGGSSRLVVDLIERLGARYEQAILTSFVPAPAAYVGARVTVLDQHASDSAFTALLAEFAPAFVHVHYWGDCDERWYRRVFNAAGIAQVPILENVNTPVAPLRAPAVKRYVYVSNYVKHRFGDASFQEEVIHPGSDFSLFSPRTGDGAERHAIGMVYRLEPDKLDEQAIEPLIEVVRRRPQTHVIIVGGGTLLAPFRDRVHAAGLSANFEFTGYVPYTALPGIYERLAVFVAPVWQESFGQVSSFAMSMGVPVTGYDVGAIPEIVDDPTLVAPAGDRERLAEIITGLLADPQRRMAIAARQRQRAHAMYSVESMIERYAALYAEMTEISR